ncbi:hypothetical protein GJ496_001212 [Pomphorhynchus laevis]|nr:hypothetical protein GJ496_001212 [Pomphorhynchus laevis]
MSKNSEASLVSLNHMIGETTVREKLASIHVGSMYTQCLLRATLLNCVQHNESRFYELNDENIIRTARSIRGSADSSTT